MSINNIHCGYQLNLSQQGDSSEYPQCMFIWRIEENYHLIIITYVSGHWTLWVAKDPRLLDGDNKD